MRIQSLSCIALLAMGAFACNDESAQGPNQNRADLQNNCTPSRVMMILDRSSSMQTGTIDGRTKWSIAVDAIDAVNAEYDGSMKMGLMAFPASGQCSPGNVLLQPAFNQRAAFSDALSEPPPNSGNWTPMAETLLAAQSEAALQASSGEGERYAILITDGWQWCSPYDASTRFNAVDRVEELADMGVKTFVVGFGGSVDAQALNLMAVAGGTEISGCDSAGNSPSSPNPCYYQADSHLELQNALQEIAVSISGEECDGEDNDCDGLVDENLHRSCENDCGEGSETCVDGNWEGCDAPPIEEEICDGEDNDCDGTTDPGCECVTGDQRPCGEQTSVGECHGGVQSCDENGQWGDCIGEVLPSEEICDGKDNDCNGEIDDLDVDEVCDGQDNDCDGEVDEDLVRACSTDCGLGEESCQDGTWEGCDAPAPQEDVCDGQDNDCNGVIDDDCDCSPGDEIECGESDVGECRLGTQRCDNNGEWLECEGAINPELEICDGLDNDCDGETDESNGLEVNSTDDVVFICPVGDETQEDPQESGDPEPTPPGAPVGGAVSNCSTAGSTSSTATSYGLLFLALAFLRRRRRD